jgi:hypothetical protein
LLAGIMITWGLACIYLPPEQWGWHGFDGLRRFADQQWWGAYAASLGLCRMIALFINGSMRRTPHMRAIGAFLSAFIWLQMSFGMMAAPAMTISLAIYPWLFVADIYNVYRAAQDAAASDQRAKFTQGASGNAASAQH